MKEFYLVSPLQRVWWWGGVTVTQLFGQNENGFYGEMGYKGHNGIDMRTLDWQGGIAPVYAAHDGYVVSDATIQSDTAGRYVKLRTPEIEIDGKKCYVETTYFHLSKARVSITDDINRPWFDIGRFIGRGNRWIKAGTLIGYSGNTGRYTTGPHLHFGMCIYWKQADGSFKLDVNNGYGGAVDPMPYFRDDHVYQVGDMVRTFYVNGKEVDEKFIKPYLKPQKLYAK